MYLIKARVTNFKSVLDSGWFTLGQLTCLVGKNESGKTAILEALEKLQSVRSERQPLRDTEYPRMNWSEYEESDKVDIAVMAVWQLDDEEVAELTRIVGDAELLKRTTVTLSKNYDNELEWELPFNLREVGEAAVASSALSAAEKKALGAPSNTSDVLNALREVDEPSPRQVAVLEELDQRWPQGGAQFTATKYLNARLPSFVYYSQYDRLPGRVSLNQLSDAKANGTLGDIPGAPVFLALLSMVGTSAEALHEIDTSEQLISKLEAVQTRLSRRVFKYWSQNKHLKVQFRLDHAQSGDQPPFNAGRIFQTRIENQRHNATIRLDERSTGFIWFFSFLVWFSEVQKQFGDRLIVLLDEPGLTLHARAQADLLRYFNEELLPKYQVIYTTHSPFMIEPSKLTDCRTVEDATSDDGEVLGTQVGDRALSADGDTLFPLQAALGYDITQTLFVGSNALLVEGPSDLLYLQWASDRLRAAKRIGLNLQWTTTPCGGITKVPSFMALFGGNRLNIAVLTDFGAGDKKKVRDLRDSELLDAGRIISAEAYAEDPSADEADIEDILGRAFYIDLIAKCYGLTAKQKLPKVKPADAPKRVVAEVEDHFRTLPASVAEFDHYAPARYLIEHADEFGSPQIDGALDRFERLIVKINELL